MKVIAETFRRVRSRNHFLAFSLGEDDFPDVYIETLLFFSGWGGGGGDGLKLPLRYCLFFDSSVAITVYKEKIRKRGVSCAFCDLRFLPVLNRWENKIFL